MKSLCTSFGEWRAGEECIIKVENFQLLVQLPCNIFKCMYTAEEIGIHGKSINAICQFEVILGNITVYAVCFSHYSLYSTLSNFCFNHKSCSVNSPFR